MKLRTFGGSLLSLSLIVIPSINSSAYATSIANSNCSKLGSVETSSGAKYHCTKVGKKLIWVKATASSKTGSISKSPVPKVSNVKQIISAPQISTVDIASGIFPGSFIASSKLAVELSTSTPTICAIQNRSVVLLETGTCLIVATQPGNNSFLPADPLSFSLQINPPTVKTDNSLLSEVQTFIRVPKGQTFASATAEVSLTSVNLDASTKVCANDPAATGCTLVNKAGIPDPSSSTRYVEFVFHVKNLDANPLPIIVYRLLLNGEITDISAGVTLPTLNDLSVGSGESADGSLFATVPINLKLAKAYLLIDEGITDSSVRLLMDIGS